MTDPVRAHTLFPIDKGVPIPDKKLQLRSPVSFTMLQLQPGESFWCGISTDLSSSTIRQFKKHHPDRAFIARKAVNSEGKPGVRIWRTA